jgi:hypothetical protein
LASRGVGWLGCVVASIGGASAALAQDAADPGLELLEYLGSWQGSDEEWLAIIDWHGDEADAERGEEERTPPADGSKEKDDDADRD